LLSILGILGIDQGVGDYIQARVDDIFYAIRRHLKDAWHVFNLAETLLGNRFYGKLNCN